MQNQRILEVVQLYCDYYFVVILLYQIVMSLFSYICRDKENADVVVTDVLQTPPEKRAKSTLENSEGKHSKHTLYIVIY